MPYLSKMAALRHHLIKINGVSMASKIPPSVMLRASPIAGKGSSEYARYRAHQGESKQSACDVGPDVKPHLRALRRALRVCACVKACAAGKLLKRLAS